MLINNWFGDDSNGNVGQHGTGDFNNVVGGNVGN